MKKILILFTALILLCGNTHAQTLKKKYPRPLGNTGKVKIRVNDKTRSYYTLDATDPAIILVSGPGTLRVISRGTVSSGDKGKTNYTISYSVDGTEFIKKRFTRIPRSKQAHFLTDDAGDVAAMRDFEIDLGRGDHSLRFLINDADDEVALRYIFIPRKAERRSWLSYNPESVECPVTLVSRENTTTYYRFSSEKPLVVVARGPAELRIMTRIENHYHMKGRINYRLQVTENGKTVNTYLLNSRRSEVTSYLDDPTLVPGIACEFIIDVPQGKHIYQIAPLDKDKGSVLGRILIPEKDIEKK